MGFFLLIANDGVLTTVPTIPIVPEEIRPRNTTIDFGKIKNDENIGEKVKWYVQPIIFGGSPTEPQNMIWITIDEHIQLVTWWNDKYDEIKGK